MGTSLLYHLAKEGWTDCVLIEKAELTSGSTWHAAGQVGHSTSHWGLALMSKYASETYSTIEAETEQSVSWHGSGSLRLFHARNLDIGQPALSFGLEKVLDRELAHQAFLAIFRRLSLNLSCEASVPSWKEPNHLSHGTSRLP